MKEFVVPVKKTAIEADLTALVAELRRFEEKHRFDERNQLSLKCRLPNSTDAYGGIGSIYDHQAKDYLFHEKDFRYFHQDILGGEFEKLHQRIEKEFQVTLGRCRIMKMLPKVCYSIHTDETERFHLVLHTNPQALLLFPNHGICHLPRDSYVYLVDTTEKHTALNAGSEPRYHLVFSAAAKLNQSRIKFELSTS